MFIGHYAVAFAAKKTAPQISLGTLFLSVQLLDLIWPILLLLGIEHVHIAPGNTAFTPLDFYDYPWSHSLLTVLMWSAGFAIIYYLMTKCKAGAWILSVGVLSHWILDFVTHRPDMPLTPGTTMYVGLGLWNSVAGTIIVEGLMFLIGVGLYLRTTSNKDRIGTYAFWSLLAFLVFAWIANMFSPPPPNVNAIAYSALLLWLIVPWGYWVDRHRVLKLSSH